MRNTLLLLTFLASFGLLPGLLPAAILTVPGTHANLAAAVAAAAPGDVIRITTNGPHEIVNLLIDKNLTIEAATGIDPLINIGFGAAVGILLSANVSLTLNDLTIDGSANPIDLLVRSVELANGSTTTINRCTFRNASDVHIYARNLTVPFTLNVNDSHFTGSNFEAVMIRNCSGNINTVNLINSIFEDAGDDTIRVRNNTPINMVIDGCIVRNTTESGAEGIQVGGSGATGTVLITNNVIYSIGDTAIEPDGANLTYTIENNTVYNVGTAIRFDVATFTGGATIRYNILSQWNESLIAQTSDKGFAMANRFNHANITENFNLLVDNSGGITQLRLNVPVGSATIATTDINSVFCSLVDGSDAFLKIRPNSPAINIDGAGRNAGALPVCVPSLSVETWMMFE